MKLEVTKELISCQKLGLGRTARYFEPTYLYQYSIAWKHSTDQETASSFITIISQGD